MTNKYRRKRINQIYTDFLPQPIPYLYKLRSAGFTPGASYIESSQPKKQIQLIRGLTLTGLKAGDEPTTLAHYDSCGQGEVKDVVSLEVGFNDLIAWNSKKYGAFAILRMTQCCMWAPSLDRLFKQTGLTD